MVWYCTESTVTSAGPWCTHAYYINAVYRPIRPLSAMINDGLGAGAHPREYSIIYTDHNLSLSSSVRYLGTTQGAPTTHYARYVTHQHWIICLLKTDYYNWTSSHTETYSLGGRSSMSLSMSRQHSVSPKFPNTRYDWLGTRTGCDVPAQMDWALCQKEHSNDSSDSETLQPRTTRIISNKDPNRSFFLMVPGGRYLVSAGRV